MCLLFRSQNTSAEADAVPERALLVPIIRWEATSIAQYDVLPEAVLYG